MSEEHTASALGPPGAAGWPYTMDALSNGSGDLHPREQANVKAFIFIWTVAGFAAAGLLIGTVAAVVVKLDGEGVAFGSSLVGVGLPAFVGAGMLRVRMDARMAARVQAIAEKRRRERHAARGMR